MPRYESELRKLEGEVVRLHRERDAHEPSTNSSRALARSSLRESRPSSKAAELERLHAENLELKRRERHFVKQRAFLEELTLKSDAMAKRLASAESEAKRKRKEVREYEQWVAQLQAEMESMDKGSSVVNLQLEQAILEAVELREANRRLQGDQKADHLVFKFAKDGPMRQRKAVRKSALDIVHKLEREVGWNNPKCHALLQKLHAHVESLEADLVTCERRNQDLMQGILDYQQQSDKATRQLQQLQKERGPKTPSRQPPGLEQ